jgi:predicted dehydrogenase
LTVAAGVRIAVVGLHFGSEFVPIYQHHPDVGELTIVDSDARRLEQVGETFGIERRYSTLEALLDDPDVDAVHVATPVAYHARHSVAVLESGKHCACAVPMATSHQDLEAVVAAQERSGKQYMMMETTVFGREFLYVRRLVDEGCMGELTFYRGFHMQDLDGFPSYWMGYPPMHYITHALAPGLALADTTVESVTCLGSGVLDESERGDYGPSFPLEAGLFRLRGHPMVADITMSFFRTARRYIEGFALYGTRMGVEWPSSEGGPLRVHTMGAVPSGGRGRSVAVEEVTPPDFSELLPPEIAMFTRPVEIGGAAGARVHVGAAHSGSHPHLVNELVASITQGRSPAVDARTAAAWTAPGISAHDSAVAGGVRAEVPDFSVERRVPVQ